MSILAAILEQYGVKPDQVRFWDQSNSRFNADDFPAVAVLAQHRAPVGWISVLTHWMVYYRPPADPLVPIPEGDLHFFAPDDGVFFDLTLNGAAVQGLEQILETRSSWSSNTQSPAGQAFYMSPFGRGPIEWQLRFTVAAGLPADVFEVAGRIIGFDFPAAALDRSQLEEI